MYVIISLRVIIKYTGKNHLISLLIKKKTNVCKFNFNIVRVLIRKELTGKLIFSVNSNICFKLSLKNYSLNKS